MSRELARTELSDTGLMCWEAALEAFGVTARTGKRLHLDLIKQHLHQAGWRTVDLLPGVTDATFADMSDGKAGYKEPTLDRFIAAHPTGDYIVSTAGHCMALRDGQLTDTDTAKTGRRRVQSAYAVIPLLDPPEGFTPATITGTVIGPGVNYVGPENHPLIRLEGQHERAGQVVCARGYGDRRQRIGDRVTLTGKLGRCLPANNARQDWPPLLLAPADPANGEE